MQLDSDVYLVGRLWCHNRNGRESASFEYDDTWLKHNQRYALEPALTLSPGAFHTTADKSLFGSIGDSAPDRWGRLIMRRAEAIRAKKINEVPRTLREVDFLLGVSDEARQGALRFSETMNGVFLAPKDQKAIPPFVELSKLLSATERFLDDKEDANDMRLFLAPGSSLGGARPKASIRDKEGNLAIAKFARKDDEHNVVVWEAVTLSLAAKAGISLSEWQLHTILKKPTLIIRRFDRRKSKNGEMRIPFLSAMSMLGAKDHEEHSYLEIIDALLRYGASPEADMCELWRRIVFSVLVSNTDDHLRNHGFIYEKFKGWRLSPAYDINPTPMEIKPRILTTTIDLKDGSASLELALSVAENFRLSKSSAKKIIKQVAASVTEWRKVAQTFGISKTEINRMSSAFEHQDLQKALAI
jgi:serine/threonine-protein kinase HipA